MELRKRITDTSSVLKKIVISYGAILLAIAAIWLSAMHQVSEMAREQNDKNYSSLLEVLSYSMDKELLIAEHAALNVAISNAVTNLLQQETQGSERILRVMEVKDQLSDVMKNQSVVTDSYFYIKDRDYVVAYNTTGETLTYYRTYIKSLGISYEDWLDWLNDIRANGYYLMETDIGKYVFYVYRAPINSVRKQALVVLQLSDTSLRRRMNEDLEFQNIGIEIISNNGQTIVSCEKDEEGCQVIQVVSRDTGWTYRGYIENEAFNRSITRVTGWMIVGVAATTLICAAALLISFRTHYLPLQKIVKSLGAVTQEPGKWENEYRYIEESLGSLLNRQKEDQQEIEQQGEKLKEVYLQYLISGRCRAEQIREADLSLFQMQFILTGFALICLMTEDENLLKEICGSDGIYWSGHRLQRAVPARRRDGMAEFYFNTANYNREELKEKLERLLAAVSSEKSAEPEASGMTGTGLKISVSGFHAGGEFVSAAAAEQEELNRALLVQSEQTVLLFWDDYAREKKQNHLKQELQEYINAHFQEPDLSVETVCQAVHKSVSGVNKSLKERGEDGVLFMINERRVEEARRIFRETKGMVPVKDVMSQAGFENQNTFTRVFKKYEGITPGEFCKECKKTEG